MDGRVYKGDNYTLLQVKHRRHGPCGFRKVLFLFVLFSFPPLKVYGSYQSPPGWVAGRICNNFLVDCALFDKSMKFGTGVDL